MSGEMEHGSDRRDLHEKALEMVREEYETAATMHNFALRVGVDHINRVRPPSLRCSSVDEIFREFLHAASEVGGFAVGLGIISSEEFAQIIRDFFARHPELPRNEEFEIPKE